MSTFEVVVSAFVVDGANFVWIEIRIILMICDGGLVTPRPFPKFVKHSQVLVGLKVALVVLNRRVDAYCFERCFLPACNNVPAASVISQCTIMNTKCSSRMETHPMRPLVMWSKVEKRFASKKGGSNDVEAVIPNARFVVTAAIAEMGIVGSVIGHCAARLIQSSRLPW